MKARLFSLAVLVAILVLPLPYKGQICKPSGAVLGRTERVSIASDGTQANGPSESPSISADGRYVAFVSFASNLVDGDNNNNCDVTFGGIQYTNCSDIFVHDRQTQQTTRVSISSEGTQANYASSSPSITADGHLIAFDSYATNLVNGDTNDRPDVFVHDLLTGQTTRISVASDGSQANDTSRGPSISADGRYVAFYSYATNLVDDDTNDQPDVFIYDQRLSQTTRVSIASDGSQGNGASYDPSISGDGRYVAFGSYASNLVPDDTNSSPDIFVHDRQTNQTRRVSVASDGSQSNGPSFAPSISADGHYVAFQSFASNLVEGDVNNTADIFVHDLQTGQTTRVSVASNGTEGNDASKSPSISPDGRYVVFSSRASNLVDNDTNGGWDVFIHDRQTAETTRVLATCGVEASSGSFDPSISGGRYIAFYSYAPNLVQGDTNNVQDVFTYDREAVCYLVYLPLILR